MIFMEKKSETKEKSEVKRIKVRIGKGSCAICD